MKLSQSEYRDIMHQYDQIRQENLAREIARRNEIHEKIPEIRAMDEAMVARKAAKARYRLFHPEESSGAFTSSGSLDPSGALEPLKDSLYIDDKRDREKKSLLLTAHHYPPDYLDPIYTCRLCRDTGYVRGEKCVCFSQKISRLFLERSHLKDYASTDHFGRFRLDYYSREPIPGKKLSPYENISRIYEVSQQFIRSFPSEEGKNLFVYGNAGVGKTFLTRCIGAEILRLGCRVLYLTSYQLFSQLADYTFRREEYEGETPEEILNADLLIIDDLGTELSNTFTNSQLFLCINERILKKKSTIISTNLSLKQISAAYTERVFSRIVESYTLLHIYGEDIRVKKAFSSLD